MRGNAAASKLAQLGPTKVFDSYWAFAAERQKILFRRLAGGAPHWTDDPVLQRFKFTNAYRATDRVSQYLIREVLGGEGADGDPINTLFRILLFKLFNRIDTWELLRREVGEPRWSDFSAARYGRVLDNAMERGERVYSAAYIVPPVHGLGVYGRKHHGHLALIGTMLGGSLLSEVRSSGSLGELFALLQSYPSLGPFLGYQLAIDINYSDVVAHEESEFVVAGPGALDGIAKCFTAAQDLKPEEVIALVCAAQKIEFERRNLDFLNLFGRPLQLIDCQNLFCEISKYARVVHPDVAGRSGRTRIKQSFVAHPRLPALVLPPKWGLDSSRLPPMSSLY